MTQTFDIADALPDGTTVLEASAGTGKTWTVGALVARYVAEGEATLDEMLLITFSRAASQELRERVRAALVEAERALADPDGADRSDALVGRLLAADAAEPGEPARRLRDALAAYDGATIATTHEFCQLVLRSLGVAGDTDARAPSRRGPHRPRRRGHRRPLPRPVRRPGVAAVPAGGSPGLARDVVEDPQATITPDDDDESTRGGARVAFAHAVRTEVDRRKRRLGVLSFDDLLSRLAAALEAEDAPARTRMQARWRIVMVDEFQDTDPVQWHVIERAFVGRATVVLIGDPKQAIYRFRGGDVVTYLRARDTADTLQTLGTNWRSDAALLESLHVVLEGAALGHPEIVVHPVRAHHPGSRLVGAPGPAPFRIRQVVRDGFALTRDGEISAGDARAHIAHDCAADIARLLASMPRGTATPSRPVTSRSWSATATRGCWSRSSCGHAGSRPWSPVAARCSRSPRPTTGWRCSKDSPSPTGAIGSAPRHSPASSATRPSSSTPVATPSPTRSPTGSGAGRCCCGARAWRRSSRRPRRAGSASGSCDASAASGS